MDDSTYVVIHGRSGSNKTATEYVEHIVYGKPKVTAIEVGERFVALCSYDSVYEGTVADYTVARMGSFPHGAKSFANEADAMQEFADWITYYASTEKAVKYDAGV